MSNVNIYNRPPSWDERERERWIILLRHSAFVRVGTINLDLKCPFGTLTHEQETSAIFKRRTDPSFFLKKQLDAYDNPPSQSRQDFSPRVLVQLLPVVSLQVLPCHLGKTIECKDQKRWNDDHCSPNPLYLMKDTGQRWKV